MRSREEIIINLVDTASDTSDMHAIGCSLGVVIELLLDIRDYLQRIDLEMPTEPVDTYVKTR